MSVKDNKDSIGFVEEGGCPCLLVEPCHKQCSCAKPVMSYGCHRCCSYGSIEQRVAMAKRLAAIIDAGNT